MCNTSVCFCKKAKLLFNYLCYALRSRIELGCDRSNRAYAFLCVALVVAHFLFMGVFFMKALGIIRKLNDNGRIVIPMEMRKKLNIDAEDSEVEIFTDEKGIYIRKYESSCKLCGSTENIQLIGDNKICRRCIEKISNV